MPKITELPGTDLLRHGVLILNMSETATTPFTVFQLALFSFVGLLTTMFPSYTSRVFQGTDTVRKDNAPKANQLCTTLRVDSYLHVHSSQHQFLARLRSTLRFTMGCTLFALHCVSPWDVLCLCSMYHVLKYAVYSVMEYATHM